MIQGFFPLSDETTSEFPSEGRARRIWAWFGKAQQLVQGWEVGLVHEMEQMEVS